MPDDPTPGGTPPVAPAPPGAPATPAQPQTVDLSAQLASVPDDVLFKDPRFTTLVGRHAQRQAERERERIQAEADAKAARDQEQAMVELAQSNPFEFSQKWLGGKAEEVARREFSELESRTQRQMLDAVGKAYGSVPEWKELTPEEFQRVAAAASGKSGADLIAAFNAAALDAVAERKSRKLSEAQVKERLAKEREAWEREAAAARLRGEPVPDMSRATTLTGRFDPTQLSDADFKQWYEQNMLR